MRPIARRRSSGSFHLSMTFSVDAGAIKIQLPAARRAFALCQVR
jgi:hypothetical protein